MANIWIGAWLFLGVSLVLLWWALRLDIVRRRREKPKRKRKRKREELPPIPVAEAKPEKEIKVSSTARDLEYHRSLRSSIRHQKLERQLTEGFWGTDEDTWKDVRGKLKHEADDLLKRALLRKGQR